MCSIYKTIDKNQAFDVFSRKSSQQGHCTVEPGIMPKVPVEESGNNVRVLIDFTISYSSVLLTTV